VWVLWLIVVSALLVGVVLVALGWSDGLADEELDDVIVDLPEDRPLLASDVDGVRLPLALRGYRMADVDLVLDRLSAELATRDAQIRQLKAGDDSA
jgi:DivIVA domain-containing protein